MSNIFSMNQVLKTDSIGFDFLSSLYGNLKKCGKDIYVDFGQMTDIDGNLASVLGAVFNKLLSEGHSVSLIKPRKTSVKRSLGRIKFLEAWNVETEVLEKEYYIPYKEFKANDNDVFKKYIKEQLIDKQRFPLHTEMVEKKIIESVYEVYANAITHSNSNSVVCCGEYEELPKILHFTIVDCGTTIPNNVNAYLKDSGKDLLDACDSIKWAFVDGNTTKPKEQEPGGLGLGILKEFISLNNGSLDLISGKGYVSLIGSDMRSKELIDTFPGTIINMNINFDDSAIYSLESEEEIDFNNLL